MDIDSISPRSQPLPLPLQIPPLWLPGPLMPTPAHSRESSMATLRMSSSWPPKWDPSPTTPPFSYDNLYNPTLDTLEGIPNTPPTPHLRTQDQPQPQPDPPTTEWWNARNDPPPALPQPLATALANARSTVTTLATLSTLLTQLLTSPPKTASGCPARLPHHDPAATTPAAVTDSWLLQVLLPLHPTLDHAPAALHALQRLCMHAAAVAADDVAALQDRAAVSPKRFARFVAKWAAFGEGASDDDDVEDDEDDERGMTRPGASAQAESQGEEFSVADCLDFVAAFTEVWEGRRGIRVRGGGGGCRRRVRDAAVEAGDGAGDGREVSGRVLERCRANVAHVLALLDRVAAELDAEVEIRANCTHLPVRCRNIGAADAGLWVARGHIDGMMVAVEGDRKALMGWEGSGIQAGERDDGGRREVGQGRLVRRWMHLSEREGGWGWGMVTRADEIVRRIGAGTWVDLGGRGRGEKRLEVR